MLSHPFLSLQAAEAGPGESESGDEEGLSLVYSYTIHWY